MSIWDPLIEKVELPFKLCSNAKEAFVQKDAAAFTVKHVQFKRFRKRIVRLTASMRTPLIFDSAGIFRDIMENPRRYIIDWHWNSS